MERGDSREKIAEEYKNTPRRRDHTGRLVVEKSANMPYFAHQEWKKKQEKLRLEKEERQKARAELIAKGIDPGPDPDAPKTFSAGNIFKFFFYLLIGSAMAGQFLVGDFKWGYETKYLTKRFWRELIPDPTQTKFSESQLAKYDGSNPEMPIFLAIDGDVYDVTAGRHTYGPGGSYHQFAGRDAARAFVTGCFKIHLTHDVRGFDEKQKAGLKHWKDFYANSDKYKKVGTVHHQPIHPSTPLPPPCDKNGDPIVEDKDSKSGPDLPPAAVPPPVAQQQKPKEEL